METNTGQCPLCGSELSRAKFHEIQEKKKDDERRRLAEIENAELALKRRLGQEFDKQLEQERRAIQKKSYEEAELRIRKAEAAREVLEKKVREGEAREAEIVKQAQLEIEKQKCAAATKAKKEAENQIAKANEERDRATQKLKEAQARETEVLRLAQEEADKRQKKELADQRQILDKDKTQALLKQQSEFIRQREGFEKTIHVMKNQLQRKTANELGDGGEIDVFEALRDSYHGDKITRTPKGQAGADILQEVSYKGEICGRIIFDIKNRQAWQNTFVTKLRQDQVVAGAEHAILATTVFPSGKKEMCIESGVIVISPRHVVHVVGLLRQAMVTMHVRGLSMKERTTKMNRLYKLITSESYNAKFIEAGRLTKDILDLEIHEQNAHSNVWKKRGALVKRMQNVLREVETEVSAVIEAGEEGAQMELVAKSAAGTSR